MSEKLKSAQTPLDIILKILHQIKKNKWLMYATMCNYNIRKHIPFEKIAEALVFYITNYVTKNEMKMHNFVALIGSSEDVGTDCDKCQ